LNSNWLDHAAGVRILRSNCTPHRLIDSPVFRITPMLTLWGQGARYCDGIQRRDFLRLGALVWGA
jgi:hypothetical protein